MIEVVLIQFMILYFYNLVLDYPLQGEYTPLEVVDIQEGECWLCDTWTPVFDDDKTVKQEKIR